MRVQLADGNEAHVFVRYTEVERTWREDQTKVMTGVRRAAVVQVTLPSGETVEGTSVCIPPDPFVKKTGRFLAARALAEKLRPMTSREDRARILKPIFGA